MYLTFNHLKSIFKSSNIKQILSHTLVEIHCECYKYTRFVSWCFISGKKNRNEYFPKYSKQMHSENLQWLLHFLQNESQMNTKFSKFITKIIDQI